MESAPPYQPELIPMQGNKYQCLVDPKGVPLAQQHSTVRIANPGLPSPRDHIIWSIFSLVYMNPCCLGLAAVYFSIKSRDRKVTGDLESAREYGSTARCLNITALTLTLICFIILIAIVIVTYATAYTYVQQLLQQKGSYDPYSHDIYHG